MQIVSGQKMSLHLARGGKEFFGVAYIYVTYEDRSRDNESSPSSNEREHESSFNISNSWKTYADPQHFDYLLVILPTNMDRLYYSTTGILLHPREESVKLQILAAEKKLATKQASGKKKTKNKKVDSKALITCIDSTLDFCRHAL